MDPQYALQLMQLVLTRKFGLEVHLSERQQQEWLRLFEYGYAKAIEQERQNDFDQAVVTVVGASAQQAQLVNIVDGTQQVQLASALDSLKSVCPLWPFC